MVLKVDSLNFYKPPTGLLVVKTDFSNFKSGFLLGGGQNGVSEHQQPSYTQGGGQNRLSELLLASYTLVSGQNGPYKLLQG